MFTVFGKRVSSALLLTLLITTFACKKKDHNDTPATPSGQLTGTVQTWDDKQNQISDKGGITVSAIDGGDSIATTTDTSGKFAFNNLPLGTYKLVLSKAGYGTMKIFGISHTNQNGTQVPLINFGKMATTTAVTVFSVRDSALFQNQPGVRFHYILTPPPSATQVAYLRYFLGTDSTLSSSNYLVADTLRTFASYKQAGYFSSELKSLGFTAGQTIYVRMYSDSYISNSYLDSATGKQVSRMSIRRPHLRFGS